MCLSNKYNEKCITRKVMKIYKYKKKSEEFKHKSKQAILMEDISSLLYINFSELIDVSKKKKLFFYTDSHIDVP